MHKIPIIEKKIKKKTKLTSLFLIASIRLFYYLLFSCVLIQYEAILWS